MANPPKVKDPAEAALSAVEEALKLDFGGPATAAGSEDGARAALGEAARAERPGSGSADAADNTASGEGRRGRGRGGRPPAANDDRRTIGNLIFALQRRPSAAPSGLRWC
ncbi:hypothetical protein [Pannonibacter phragmitetus]|uniref:hypothetical protein n=1 Tax=Pannonibacter phragmitetus TaxID=121719 RepID=UPI003D2F0499